MTAQSLCAAWLDEARRRAWDVFLKTDPPARTVETWRRVRFGSWRLEHAGADDLADACVGQADAAVAPRGVERMTLEEAAAHRPEIVEPRMGGWSAGLDFRKFEALNLARFCGGRFLHVPRGVKVQEPVMLSFAHDPKAPFAFPRVLVVVEDGAEATVVEEHTGGGRTSSIAFSRACVGQGASLRYFYVQTLEAGAAHFWHQGIDLSRDSRLEHSSALLGASVHKSLLDVRLAGPGARSELYGAVFGSGSQLFDPRTVQDHRAPFTTSDLLYRAALKDRARSIYTGLVRVEQEARGTEAYQQNNNVLLSNGARADSTPVLEILTDEVRCKHGATVGPMNPEEIFYLQSRGLSLQEATRMLLLGFLDPVLGRLPSEALRKRLTAYIAERLTA